MMTPTEAMLERCARCARRGPHGEWILIFDDPHDDIALGMAFLADIARTIGAVVTEDPPAPTNLRIVSPAWLEQCDKIAEQAARDLSALVVMVAAQEMGKLAITMGGKDLPGEELAAIKEIAGDVPRFLRAMAHLAERMGAETAEPEKPEMQVHFLPGCFDEFEGTQEELQALIAEVHRLAESGELLERGRQLSRDEFEELKERLQKKGPPQ